MILVFNNFSLKNKNVSFYLCNILLQYQISRGNAVG